MTAPAAPPAAAAPAAAGPAFDSAIPPGVGRAIADAQAWLDPLMPWLLAALLALAGAVLWRQRTPARAGAAATPHGATVSAHRPRGATVSAHRPRGATASAHRPRGATASAHRPRGARGLTAPYPLAVLAALALALGGGFAGLAAAVAQGPGPALQRLDAAVAARADALQTPAVDWLAVRLGDVGDVLPLGLLTLAVALWLWRQGERALTAGWLLGIGINSVGVRVLKNGFERARPHDMPDVLTSGFSFPSGHAAGALMVFGLLGWLLQQRLAPGGRPWALGAGLLLALAIAASRVLLGVHHASDVLAGLLWGGLVLLLTTQALARVRGG